MLKTLTVENFAIIENITVEFGGGLNILTGETGAGKSILIEALGAILGNKIGAGKIRKGTDFLRIEAKFSDGLKITRKVSRTGKNSIAANGKPITLAALKKLGATLVDMHGQNQNLEILREENIYKLIDDEKILSERENFQRLYRALNSKVRELEKKISARAENLQRLEFLRWQEREISAARLKPNEDEKIDAEIKKLSHAEKIAEHVQESAQILNDGDADILTALARVEKNLDDVARYDDKLNSARKLLEEAEINLREAYEEIRNYGGDLDFSPERLDKLHARADVIFKLKQKYGASVNEILQRLEKIRADIAAVENFDSDVDDLKREVVALERETKSCAEKLLEMRRAAAKTLSAKIETEIQRLGMARAQFEIVVEPTEKFSKDGGDTADILFCANVGEEKLSLSKIVSGGELSRVSLAIKTVTAWQTAATMVFDEIDTGLGGITARTVAEAIAKISRGRQVLCITHLPQIASMADIHLQINKSEIDGRTITKVKRLDDEERVKEIARMASGEESAASIKNAREMISSAKKFLAVSC
ncbi:MAG: DNA repair protein RecN [Quinella sp. 3Q1]|nr:DNA repair protein RecN [Quinella sp. 3Q1]MBR3051182.1 DNA repair protein RecN [Selenomonadaceae bacterium]MBR6888894.1 DNA repair protein RecN [Selenomonadaceae bacterium]